ncbi:acetoacetate decarboxylase (ADC) [Pseudoalteromonas sp. XI10]|nr:acetoacetate decarboxylase (ADC) [Pseudoalteromonas sp. XI10]
MELAGEKVPVVKGGLYDQYRSNPPLSVIAEQAPDVDLSWFKTIKKQKVDMGFESYSPNFYYKNSKITAVFSADLDMLTSLIPASVLEHVEPISLWPGRGLVAITAYAYHYCDNDTYNELAISVITTKPGSWNLGAISLLNNQWNDDFWGVVLKLPVDTELARVRGVVGYNLPKWTTKISYKNTPKTLTFSLFDNATNQPDVIITGKKLSDESTDEKFVRNSFMNHNQQGQLTTGYADNRYLRYASSTSDEDVSLELHQGELSQFIRSLDLGSMIKYEYVPDFQSALYAPTYFKAKP